MRGNTEGKAQKRQYLLVVDWAWAATWIVRSYVDLRGEPGRKSPKKTIYTAVDWAWAVTWIVRFYVGLRGELRRKNPKKTIYASCGLGLGCYMDCEILRRVERGARKEKLKEDNIC